MNLIEIKKHEFLNLSSRAIANITMELGKPRVGVFVPDGNRRMLLAFSELDSASDEFYHENARLTTLYFKQSLKVFFSHGLPTLFVPLISSNVFHRDQRYQDITLREGLRRILQSQEWLDFYNEYGIRVHVYGQLEYFQKPRLSMISEWVEELKQRTVKNKQHHLFYGFISPDKFGMELAGLGIDFFKKYGRYPDYDEQVSLYYGRTVTPAEFFIMSTKFAGLGALPPLICGTETQMYFLLAPGVLALTQDTYRAILYDLIFLRANTANNGYSGFNIEDVKLLRDFFRKHQSTVIGIGKKIGKFWVAES